MALYPYNIFTQIARGLIFISLFLGPLGFTYAQSISIHTGKTEIGINEFFQITIVAEEAQIREYSKFPDIMGFEKAGRTSVVSSTTVAGGAIGVSQRLTQKYKPQQEGIFRLRPFSIRVNGESVDSKGATIKVGPAVVLPPAPPAQEPTAETDTVEAEQVKKLTFDTRENSFFTVSASKEQVYVGESVEISLDFYVAFTDRNLIEFSNLSRQLPELIQKTRQAHAWEESVEQTEVDFENVEVNGRPFLRFGLYRTFFFPLTANPIQIPALTLEMIRYRMLKTPAAPGISRASEMKTYNSEPLRVRVRQLPEHPLREKVAVGNYRLREEIATRRPRTGKSFQYIFQIEGSGNLAALTGPEFNWPQGLKAYTSEVHQRISRHSSRVQGSKSFRYILTAEEPGEYRLAPAIHWVYFNPETGQYDTLRSRIRFNAIGPSSKNAAIAQMEPDAFYSAIETADNDLLSLEEFDRIKLYANFVLLFLFLILIFIYFKN